MRNRSATVLRNSEVVLACHRPADEGIRGASAILSFHVFIRFDSYFAFAFHHAQRDDVRFVLHLGSVVRRPR